MAEAEALRLVARKDPSVPVPAVRHIYRDERSGMGYLILEKLQGEPLSDHWTNISLDERKDITTQLANYVREWRKIRGSFPGTVDGGPCPDTIFRHLHSIAAHPDASYGLYGSRCGFTQGVVDSLRNLQLAGHRDALDDQTESRIFAGKEEFDDDEMILKHGDWNMGNILVKDGVVTGVVDWGGAGYRIKEREYLEAKVRGTDRSWEEAIDDFVPAFPDRFALWEHVIIEMMAYSGV
jgi:aminoglycoside phosphotransferase (APT) family kinase protein